jgi:hypothetical protein
VSVAADDRLRVPATGEAMRWKETRLKDELGQVKQQRTSGMLLYAYGIGRK